jgi:hypothetical protein
VWRPLKRMHTWKTGKLRLRYILGTQVVEDIVTENTADNVTSRIWGIIIVQ